MRSAPSPATNSRCSQSKALVTVILKWPAAFVLQVHRRRGDRQEQVTHYDHLPPTFTTKVGAKKSR